MTSIGGDENTNDSNSNNANDNNNKNDNNTKTKKNDLQFSLGKNKEMMELHQAMTFLGQPHRRPIATSARSSASSEDNNNNSSSDKKKQQQRQRQLKQQNQRQLRQRQHQQQQQQRGGGGGGSNPSKRLDNSNEDKKWKWLKRSNSTDFSGRTAVSDDTETSLSSSAHFGKPKNNNSFDDAIDDDDDVRLKGSGGGSSKISSPSRKIKNTQQKLKKKLSCISDDGILDTHDIIINNNSNNKRQENNNFNEEFDEEASYDSDDSDQGDPTTTAFIGGSSNGYGGNCCNNSFLHASSSEGWEKADEYFIAEAHDYTQRITRQLYYMGLECPFMNVDQVIPSFGNVHAHLGSLMPQQCTLKRKEDPGDKDLLGLYTQQEDSGNVYGDCVRTAKSDDTPRKMSFETAENGNNNADTASNKSPPSPNKNESNARLFVSGYMYTKEIDIFQGKTEGYSKPKTLEEPNSFSSAITGGVDGIVAKQLHLPPSPAALLQNEGDGSKVVTNNDNNNNNDISTNNNSDRDKGAAANGEKKGWLRRVFNRKASKACSDTSKGNNDSNNMQPPSLDCNNVNVSY